MDNSTTTWIMVALLLLLIGAAVFMLLRRPGGDSKRAVDERDVNSPDAPGAAGTAGGVDYAAGGHAMGPATSEPEIDAPGGASDLPYDQDATTHEAGVADRHQVTDEGQHRVAAEDEGRWGEGTAAGVAGAAGAAGAGGATAASAAARDDEPATAEVVEVEETQYVVREDDGEPAYEQPHEEESAYERPHREERGYHDDTTPVREGESTGLRSGDGSASAYEADTVTAGTTAVDDQDDLGAGTANGGDRTGTATTDYRQADIFDEPQGGADGRGSTTYADGGTAAEDTTSGADARSADTAVGGGAAGGQVFAESVYGPGSAEPDESGRGPVGWEIKGNSGSMLYHTPESPSYDSVRTEVWFESEEAAREAGFAHWDRRRR